MRVEDMLTPPEETRERLRFLSSFLSAEDERAALGMFAGNGCDLPEIALSGEIKKCVWHPKEAGNSHYPKGMPIIGMTTEGGVVWSWYDEPLLGICTDGEGGVFVYRWVDYLRGETGDLTTEDGESFSLQGATTMYELAPVTREMLEEGLSKGALFTDENRKALVYMDQFVGLCGKETYWQSDLSKRTLVRRDVMLEVDVALILKTPKSGFESMPLNGELWDSVGEYLAGMTKSLLEGDVQIEGRGRGLKKRI